MKCNCGREIQWQLGGIRNGPNAKCAICVPYQPDEIIPVPKGTIWGRDMKEGVLYKGHRVTCRVFRLVSGNLEHKSTIRKNAEWFKTGYPPHESAMYRRK